MLFRSSFKLERQFFISFFQHKDHTRFDNSVVSAKVIYSEKSKIPVTVWLKFSIICPKIRFLKGGERDGCQHTEIPEGQQTLPESETSADSQTSRLSFQRRQMASA